MPKIFLYNLLLGERPPMSAYMNHMIKEKLIVSSTHTHIYVNIYVCVCIYNTINLSFITHTHIVLHCPVF